MTEAPRPDSSTCDQEPSSYGPQVPLGIHPLPNQDDKTCQDGQIQSRNPGVQTGAESKPLGEQQRDDNQGHCRYQLDSGNVAAQVPRQINVHILGQPQGSGCDGSGETYQERGPTRQESRQRAHTGGKKSVLSTGLRQGSAQIPNSSKRR